MAATESNRISASLKIPALLFRGDSQKLPISELHILLQTTLNQNLITSPEDEHKKAWWKFWA